MKKYLLSLAAIATMFASCTTDVDIEVKAPELLDLPTFTAELDETRTNFVDNGDGTGFVQWIENENLSIFLTMTKNRNMTYKVKEGSVKNGGKTADMTAVAMGVAPSEIINIDQNYAIYPYSENNGIKMEATGIITTKIANVQSFNPESDFANIPVVACSPDTNLSFFIPGSAYRLNVNCVDFGVPFVLKKIIFTSMSTEIAGDVEIAMDGTPEAVIVNNGSKSITLDLGEGVELSEEYRSFYIAMPSVEFPENDRTITYVYTIDGTECQIVVKKNAAANMTAGKIQPTSQTLSLPDFSASTAFPTNGGELVGDHTLTNNLSIETAMIVPAGEEATLNLNGKNIVTTKGLYIDGEVSAVICAKDGANLALFGEGAVDGSVYDDYAVESRGGNVVIKDGTYTGSVTAVYAMDGGTVTIEGGEFKVSDSKYGTTYLLNLKGNSDSSIIVKGGKFYGFDPANNDAENPAVNFVADGYISVEVEENVWEVMPANQPIEVASAAALEDVLVQGGEATLTDNITTENGLKLYADAKINLNGKTLSYTGNDVLFRVYDSGSIIINGEVANSAIYTNPTTPSNGGNGYVALAFEGAEVTFNGGTYTLVGTCTVAQSTGGQINVIDGVFDAQKEDGYARGTYTFNCKDEYAKAGKINITGGKFYYFDPARNKAENPQISFVADGYISVEIEENVWEVMPATETIEVASASALKSALAQGGDVKLSADIEVEGPDTYNGGDYLYITESANIDLNGKTLSYTGADRIFYAKGEGVVVTINATNGGKIYVNPKAGVDASTTAGYIASTTDGAKIIVNGGEFEVEGCTTFQASNGLIEINGGSFKANENYTTPGKWGYAYVLNCTDANYKAGSADIIVNGGSFYKFDPANNAAEGVGTNFVAEGYISVEIEENVWEVMPATETIEVATAAALEDVLAQGGKATLTANIVLEKSLTVTKDSTLNLNGKNITCDKSDVLVVTNGTLTINGDGVVYASSDNSSSASAVWAKENGNVVINGGTFKVGDDESSKASGNWRNDCIYARDNATITINGGKFQYTGINEEGHKFLLNLRDANNTTASIVVNGGEFYKFDPANNSAEGVGTNFVAEGKTSTANGDWYIVK